MNAELLKPLFLVIFFTLLSGYGDAQGFIHASNVWTKGKFVLTEALKSALWVTVGLIMYWFALKYLGEIKTISTEVQALGWFVVTIVSIAILSGKFTHWYVTDQIIAIIAIVCVGWLLFRTGG